MKLEGRVAIITGVGPNIGRAVALGFAKEGAKVACNHRRPEAAERTAQLIREAGGEAMTISRTPVSWGRAVARQVREHRRRGCEDSAASADA